MNFPDKSLGGHEEAEGSVTSKSSSPSVVRSVKSSGNLVEIVSSAHSPFPVVVLEDVVAESKLRWVSLSLFRLESIGASNVSLEVEVVAIDALRRFKSLVVPSWVSSLSAASFSRSLVVFSVLSCEASSLGENSCLLSLL
jgi:hypothetical protein